MPQETQNRRRALVGLAIVVALLGVGLFLARELYTLGKTEDCLMSGRTNCTPIEEPSR
jgi:hypothetical protein